MWATCGRAYGPHVAQYTIPKGGPHNIATCGPRQNARYGPHLAQVLLHTGNSGAIEAQLSLMQISNELLSSSIHWQRYKKNSFFPQLLIWNKSSKYKVCYYLKLISLSTVNCFLHPESLEEAIEWV